MQQEKEKLNFVLKKHLFQITLHFSNYQRRRLYKQLLIEREEFDFIRVELLHLISWRSILKKVFVSEIS